MESEILDSHLRVERVSIDWGSPGFLILIESGDRLLNSAPVIGKMSGVHFITNRSSAKLK
ncbi:MAG: hypothetical protein IPL46_02335 [Saprospiraceae bacterium]|nr:hypothetical protein [Saprospiraceae bacterium]